MLPYTYTTSELTQECIWPGREGSLVRVAKCSDNLDITRSKHFVIQDYQSLNWKWNFLRPSVGRSDGLLVGRSVIISWKGWTFHFQAPIHIITCTLAIRTHTAWLRCDCHYLKKVISFLSLFRDRRTDTVVIYSIKRYVLWFIASKQSCMQSKVLNQDMRKRYSFRPFDLLTDRPKNQPTDRQTEQPTKKTDMMRVQGETTHQKKDCLN